MSDHTDLPCELLTSLLIRGIQMGEMSKLGWLIGLVKHAICADSLYFLYLLLLSSLGMRIIIEYATEILGSSGGGCEKY
jgi:hypothetical protein